jgi:acyl carrier protein
MPQANEVDARVSKVLVQALGVEEEDITPTARLQGDLGAESIDFLDIVFRLEREFSIRIPRGELFSNALFQDQAQLLRDGHVTDAGLESLRSSMPYADLTRFERDRRLNQINDLFTVELLSSYVTWRLGRHEDADLDLQVPLTLIPARI